MRLEDYGKKLMTNVPPLSEDLIKNSLKEYLQAHPGTKYHFLMGKEISYYTVFDCVTKDAHSNIYDFLNSSFYELDGTFVPMSQILYTELRNDSCLELWIDKVYFHLTPFDWGVERV